MRPTRAGATATARQDAVAAESAWLEAMGASSVGHTSAIRTSPSLREVALEAGKIAKQTGSDPAPSRLHGQLVAGRK